MKFNTPTAAFQLFQIFRYGFLLLISIALAWLFPDLAVIEEYETLLLLGGSLTFFWTTGLYDGFVPLFQGGDPEAGRKLVGQVFRTALLGGLLSGLGVWFLGISLYDGLNQEALAWFAAYTALNGIGFLLDYVLLVRGRSKALIAYGFALYAATFGVLAGLLALGYGLETACFGLFLIAALRLLILGLYQQAALFSGGWNGKVMRALLKVGGPLALATLLSGSAMYIDKFLVTSFFADQPGAFALFTYGARELPLVLLLANALSVVKSGEIARAKAEGHAAEAMGTLKTQGKRLIMFLYPLSLGLMLFSEPLFRLVYGEVFVPAAAVFDVYLLLIIPRLLFPQTLLRAWLRTHILTMSAGIEVLVNIGLSLLLLQFWGLPGIALATFISYFLEKAILVVYCQVKLKIGFQIYTQLQWWAFSSLILLAVYLIKTIGF